MSQVQPGCCARCAAEWAEEMAVGNEEQWCPVCQDWQSVGQVTLNCGHVPTGLTMGAKHVDARAKYAAALAEETAGA